MNLLLFSVEVERSPVGKHSAERWPKAKSSVRRRGFETLALAAAVIVGAIAAACGTWLLTSGNDLADRFLPTIILPEHSSGQVSFNIASQPGHARLIYSAIAPLDGYVEDEQANSTEQRRMTRCTRS